MATVYTSRDKCHVSLATAPVLSSFPSIAESRLITRLTLFYKTHTEDSMIPWCNLLGGSDSRTRDATNYYKLDRLPVHHV